RRRDGAAVVGDGHAAGLTQFADVGQLLALLTARDGPNRVHARESGGSRLLENELGHTRVVVDGYGVRHARDGGEPAGDGGKRPGGDRLLVLLSRLPQVHVHIDQTGDDDEPCGNVDDGCAVRRQVATDGGNPLAVEQHVELPVAPVCRVDDPSALK